MAIEILMSLDDFGTDKVTEILEDLSIFIFVVLLKNPGVGEYKLHWTISLMSNISTH